MKKLLALILGIVMAVAVGTLVACSEDGNGGNGGNGGNSGTQLTVDQTISDTSLKVDLTGHTLYVTSAGQAADYDTMVTLLKISVGLSEDDFVADSHLVASSVAEGDTVILVAGASDKGMGSAGVDAAGEIARAKAFADKSGINLIVAQLGGEARRGETSDAIFAAVCPKAMLNLIVASADNDGKFSGNWCAEGTLYGYSRASNMANSLKFVLGV